jgi:membrane-bound serine protease (ClpP class)
MDFLLVVFLYIVGLGMVVAESMMPGVVIGLIGTVFLTISIVFGFRHHWAVGAVQIVLAVVVTPAAFYIGIKKLSLQSSLEGATSFGQDLSGYQGKEGQAHTDLRPAGMVLVDGRKLDVVTAGESIPRGSRIRVVSVEGNRVVVKAI